RGCTATRAPSARWATWRACRRPRAWASWASTATSRTRSSPRSPPPPPVSPHPRRVALRVPASRAPGVGESRSGCGRAGVWMPASRGPGARESRSGAHEPLWVQAATSRVLRNPPRRARRQPADAPTARRQPGNPTSVVPVVLVLATLGTRGLLGVGVRRGVRLLRAGALLLGRLLPRKLLQLRDRVAHLGAPDERGRVVQVVRRGDEVGVGPQRVATRDAALLAEQPPQLGGGAQPPGAQLEPDHGGEGLLGRATGRATAAQRLAECLGAGQPLAHGVGDDRVDPALDQREHRLQPGEGRLLLRRGL